MWSFSGMLYRGETYNGPVEDGTDTLLYLLTRLGANSEQHARIIAGNGDETPYEQVWREMTIARFGHMAKNAEYSTEDWPAMLGTWDLSAHRHVSGPPLVRSAIRQADYEDFCSCEADRDQWSPQTPTESCPLYEGRETE